jgi:hypothetical protein
VVDIDIKKDNLFTASLFISIACIVLGLYGLRFKFENNAQQLILFARLLSIFFIIFSISAVMALFYGCNQPVLKNKTLRSVTIKNWLAGFFIFALFAETAFFNSTILIPIRWGYLVIIAAIFVLFTVLKNKPRALLLLLFSMVIFIILKAVYHIPVESRSLILSQISDACNVITAGRNPYIGGTRMQFMYLPGLMLPYVLFFVANINLTFVNLFSFAILSVFVIRITKNSRQACYLSAVIAASVILLSIKNVQMVMDGHLAFYWLLVFCMFYLLAIKKLKLSAFFIGLAMATRQETIIWLLPFSLYFIRQAGIKKSIVYALIAIGAYSIFIIPVWVIVGNSFWYHAYFKIIEGFEKYFAGMGLPFNQISISTFFYSIAGKTPLVITQAFMIIYASLAVWFSTYKSVVKFTALCGLLSILFVSLNLLVQWYYYTTGIIVICCAIIFASFELKEV